MDLLPRLSDQQKFILAWLTEREGESRVGPVSWAVAEEFGRVIDRKERGMALAEESAESLLVSNLLGTIFTGMDRKVLSPEHRASFSRSLERLERRGLVARYRTTRIYIGGERDGEETARTTWVGLTEDGERVGVEVLKRVKDGRYGLCFETLD